MFVTSAISSLLPYMLFFGMLMLFALKSYTHPPQLSENSSEYSSSGKIVHLENNQQDQSQTRADYLDFVSKKFQEAKRLCLFIAPLRDCSPNYSCYSNIKPTLYLNVTIALRAPPALG